ncbi:hypothetical protein JK151_11280 [Ralstonia syzygii subsp. celebesensis]|nr:hypothetical protein JK151_11280 [Ralstonia syzygii subsp. celebesensis]
MTDGFSLLSHRCFQLGNAGDRVGRGGIRACRVGAGLLAVLERVDGLVGLLQDGRQQGQDGTDGVRIKTHDALAQLAPA